VRRIALAIALAVATGALLAAGYASAGQAGLADMAAVVAVAGLLLGRVLVRQGKPPPVLEKDSLPAGVRREDFPSYQRLLSDLEWAVLSRRHYERVLRPRLTSLGGAPPDPGPADVSAADDGAGPDLATLDRIITQLEEST
jgi:hypothetical protein